MWGRGERESNSEENALLGMERGEGWYGREWREGSNGGRDEEGREDGEENVVVSVRGLQHVGDVGGRCVSMCTSSCWFSTRRSMVNGLGGRKTALQGE